MNLYTYLQEKISQKKGIHIISIGPACNKSPFPYEENILCYEQMFGCLGLILSNTIKQVDIVLIDPKLPNITELDKLTKILQYLDQYYLIKKYKIINKKKLIKCYVCYKDIRDNININIYLFPESLNINRQDRPLWTQPLKTLINLKQDNYGCVIVQNFVRFRNDFLYLKEQLSDIDYSHKDINRFEN